MKGIKNIITILASVIILLIFSTKLNFENTGAFDTISTFLSISTGFSITALSIIATSSFSKNLYQLEDKKDNSKTLLHVLVNQFKLSALIFIVTIGLILLFKFIPIKEDCIFTDCIFTIKSYKVSLDILLKSTIWYMTLISFYEFIKLFKTFSKFVIKSGTN